MKLRVRFKGGPGSGHHGHRGIPGHQGGSLPGEGSANYLPAGERVWQGEKQEGKLRWGVNKKGKVGEEVTVTAMQDIFGDDFEIMNQGLNNAPVDVAGDHQAIEVKTGVATNGRSAQQWRITTSYTSGPSEDDLISKMDKKQLREYNKYKQEAALGRKYQAVQEMSDIIGGEVKAATVGVILAPDGSKADVYYIPGFHLRLGWNKYAVDKYYVGTYDVK